MLPVDEPARKANMPPARTKKERGRLARGPPPRADDWPGAGILPPKKRRGKGRNAESTPTGTNGLSPAPVMPRQGPTKKGLVIKRWGSCDPKLQRRRRNPAVGGHEPVTN